MRCPKCGRESTKGMFCAVCGTPIPAAAANPVAPQPPVRSAPPVPPVNQPVPPVNPSVPPVPPAPKKQKSGDTAGIIVAVIVLIVVIIGIIILAPMSEKKDDSTAEADVTGAARPGAAIEKYYDAKAKLDGLAFLDMAPPDFTAAVYDYYHVSKTEVAMAVQNMVMYKDFYDYHEDDRFAYSVEMTDTASFSSGQLVDYRTGFRQNYGYLDYDPQQIAEVSAVTHSTVLSVNGTEQGGTNYKTLKTMRCGDRWYVEEAMQTAVSAAEQASSNNQ